MQSELGASLLRHYGMDPEDPLSWLYLRDGVPFSSLDAVIHVGADLGGVWRLLKMLKILPRVVRDWLYGIVARHRYRIMGRADLCATANPEIQSRLLQ